MLHGSVFVGDDDEVHTNRDADPVLCSCAASHRHLHPQRMALRVHCDGPAMKP